MEQFRPDKWTWYCLPAFNSLACSKLRANLDLHHQEVILGLNTGNNSAGGISLTELLYLYSPPEPQTCRTCSHGCATARYSTLLQSTLTS